MKRFTLIIFIFTLACFHQNKLVLSKPPNIVVFLADDVGFSDIGSFGSEVHTPYLDELAKTGIRFSNYHTAATCAPSRGMLITGVDSHRNGCPNLLEALPYSLMNNDTYKGTLLPRSKVLTIAERLSEGGYDTHMSGKWNLGKEEEDAFFRGFKHSFSLADTGSDNFEYKTYVPFYPRPRYYENGVPIKGLPKRFYSSEYIIDKAIEFLEKDKQSKKPFFAYIGFQAVHIPVQAPREYTEKYLSTYKIGWHKLRQARYQRAMKVGVIPETAKMNDPENIEEWSNLGEKDRQFMAKAMAVYAAMIERMDFHIGRYMKYLKRTNEFYNTVFIFTSDNGAEPTEPLKMGISSLGFGSWMYINGYTRKLDNLGEKGSFNFIGKAWATAASSPLTKYKFSPYEGGLRVPLIISGSPLQVKDPGRVNNKFTFVKDLAATIIELAEVSSESPPGVEQMTGKSLVPVIQGAHQQAHDDDEGIGYELGGTAALFMGDYKIVIDTGVDGDGKWRMYNIQEDPGETKELQMELPEAFEKMIFKYKEYVRENGIKQYPRGYDQTKEIRKKGVIAYMTFRGSPDAYYMVPFLLLVFISILILVSKAFFYCRKMTTKKKLD